MNPVRREWDPKRVTIKLSIWAGVLVVLNMLCHLMWHEDAWDITRYRYVEMLDLDEEKGFGTWFATLILFFSARLLFLIASDSKARADGLHVWWKVLACGFMYLSLDEVAGFHEYVNAYNEDFFEGAEHEDRWWTWYLKWVVLVVGIAFLPFLWKLRWRVALLMGIAGGIYLGGAMGIEVWSPHDDTGGFFYNFGWITIEEGMEMAGIVMFIYVLLDYLREQDKTQTVRVEVSSVAKVSAEAD